MENLNAEQIKKALECCLTTSESDCSDCGYRGRTRSCFLTCTNFLIADALALINSQEQRIEAYRQELGEVRIALAEANKERQELTGENERLRAECTQLIRYPTLYEALKAIIWYDGHYEWLPKLCEGLEKAKSEGKNYPNPIEKWHTENHTIMMLLIGMFGDWGTSIRSGWIEKHDECIAFINEITKEMLEEGVT